MAYSCTRTIIMAQDSCVVVPLIGPVPLGVALFITQGFKFFLQVVRRRRPVCERVSEVLSDVPANKNVRLAWRDDNRAKQTRGGGWRRWQRARQTPCRATSYTCALLLLACWYMTCVPQRANAQERDYTAAFNALANQAARQKPTQNDDDDVTTTTQDFQITRYTQRAVSTESVQLQVKCGSMCQHQPEEGSHNNNVLERRCLRVETATFTFDPSDAANANVVGGPLLPYTILRDLSLAQNVVCTLTRKTAKKQQCRALSWCPTTSTSTTNTFTVPVKPAAHEEERLLYDDVSALYARFVVSSPRAPPPTSSRVEDVRKKRKGYDAASSPRRRPSQKSGAMFGATLVLAAAGAIFSVACGVICTRIYSTIVPAPPPPTRHDDDEESSKAARPIFPVPQFLDGTLIVEPDGSISVGLEVIEVVYYYD